MQADWPIRPSLTLNLGIRYEFATIPTEKNGRMAIMPSPTTPLPCLPTPTPADPSCSALDPTSVLRHSFWTHNPTAKNFEPRVGFAWDPFHNGKTAVRRGLVQFFPHPPPHPPFSHIHPPP